MKDVKGATDLQEGRQYLCYLVHETNESDGYFEVLRYEGPYRWMEIYDRDICDNSSQSYVVKYYLELPEVPK